MKFTLKSNELVRSFFIYGLTSGLSRFVSLLLIPIYVRVFSTTEYGVIDMIQTIVYVMLIFGLLQLETSIQRYYFEWIEQERKRMISVVFWFVLALSVIAALLLMSLSSPLSQWLFKSGAFAGDIRIAALIIPAMNMSILNFIILRYDKKAAVFSTLTFIQVISTALLTILFAVELKWGIKSVFLGQLAGFVIVVVLQSIYVKKQLVWYFDVSVLKKMLKFSLPQFPARIASESNSRMNRFILVTYLSTSSLGIYAVAVKFASAIELINSAFIMAWIPYMYESATKKDFKERVCKIFKIVTILGFFAIVLLSLFSNEIITLFTVPDYYDAKFLLPGLFLFNGLFLIKSVVDIGPALSRKTIYISYIYLSVAVLNILLLLAGVRLFGVRGIVYALVFTNFCLIIVSWYFTEKLSNIGFNILAFIFLFIISTAVIVLLMNFDFDPLSRICFALLLCGTAFFYFIKQKQEWGKLLS